MTEGLCSRHSFCGKVAAKSHYGNKPSVKNQQIFDSSLCTREPWALPRQCDILEFDEGDGFVNELYNKAKEQGQLFFHKNYCLFNNHNITAFDAGKVRLISIETVCKPYESEPSLVSVLFDDGNCSQWSSKWLTPYIFQFGVAVSFDGKFLFAQTWENGLICLDARTGEKVWKSKSKRGITNVFMNDSTILCHQSQRALQLIDIHTGEVLKEKRPATAWGFESISHNHIVCQVTAKRWEIIDAETLETKAIFSHRDFTGGYEDYCVNYICLDNNVLIVRGFKNAWDNSSDPPKMLPNLEFEHHINIELGI